MDVDDRSGIPPADLAALRRSLDPLHTLEDLLEWARHLTPPVISPIVETQDEYTHDVLVPCTDGRWLDFDTT
jgi:hypothetical protein